MVAVKGERAEAKFAFSAWAGCTNSGQAIDSGREQTNAKMEVHRQDGFPD